MKIHGIVVAKSRKLNNYCVVLFDLNGERFIRLVSKIQKDGSSETNSPLSSLECTYKNGEEIELLDELELEIHDEGANDKFQPENYFLDSTKPIKYLGKVIIKEASETYLKNFIDTNKKIFGNFNGKVYASEFINRSIKKSFLICHVENLEFYSENSSTKKLKCKFTYKEKKYRDFSPTMNSKYYDFKKYCGKTIKSALVCFSIGHAFNGFHYKFLCSILEENGISKI